ncbi:MULTISPECIES: hypothetical protein [unclassified Streptomyces]|uniref:hypothetical protein n=1 Tax=unclassified Streptomyces TaxID=2593676 RepID=UPI0015C412AF|nr:hypothetical protein [Streptomyces sp. 13-12-16]
MGQARLGDDGRYHGDLPCGWCEALIDQKGRRRPRCYCGPWHRTKSYVAHVTALIAGLF